MTTVTESGLTFGPFKNEDLFEVEKSKVYQTIQQNVPIAEFVFLRQSDTPVVFTVEAKNSSPRPGNQLDFDTFISEIEQKLTNTFSLTQAMILGRHPDYSDELSERFRGLDLSGSRHRLVLVIHGHQDEWLPPLQEALQNALKPLVKTWAIGANAVLVLNEGMARRHNLIQ